MATKLIAIDMDGTLLGTNGQVSVRTRQALATAASAGVEIVIATGRRHCYAMKILHELNLDAAGIVISSNGTVIRTIGSRLLHRTVMPLPTARWICGHISDFRDTMVITFDRVGHNGEDERGALVVEQMDQLNSSVGGWMRANEAYIECVPSLEMALEEDAPIQMMVCGSVDRMSLAQARLLEHEGVEPVGLSPHDRIHGAVIALHRTEYPERDLSILDILPAGCSKASALLWLAHHKGIDASQIMAIGDNWNDVSMLDVAGRACLMGNAPEELRSLCQTRGWEMLPSNDDHGVAIAIEDVVNTAYQQV